jgi:hypothetical protein
VITTVTATPFVFSVLPPPGLLAVTESVEHRITSGLLEGFTEWWQMPALVGVVAGLVAFAAWMIRRDAAELPRGVAVLLAMLRIGAVGALVAAYLDLERRTEHELVSPSRVAVLIDSSASMTLSDEEIESGNARNAASRADEALAILSSGGLLDALTARHEVSLWRFDADAEPLAVRPLGGGGDREDTAPESDEAAASAEKTAAQRGENGSWREQVAPRGFETRLGEALARVASEEPTGVLSGVIILSDGGTNAGVDPVAAAMTLEQAGVPVFPIGIGSERLPTNVRVADLIAPARVFPGDRFAVTGYLQPQGLAGQTVRIELAEVAADEAVAAEGGPRGRLIDTTEVRLGADGEMVAARFDVPGLDATGRRSLVLRVQPPATDRTPTDNSQTAEVEVVDRVTQVLLMAGGPSREYQFMRNVLGRDGSFAVDVILGTASKGISQDARAILATFPESAEELDAYDVIVAFDFDWRMLDAAAQARLERWVARESGGLFFVAGGIFMNSWLSDPETATIRDLHPVELRQSLSIGLEEPAGRPEPMPLAFTRDGQDAEFLWLSASRIASQTVWSEFPGIFSCFDARVSKPGATVFARPERSAGGGLVDSAPILMAGQFYGSGSVFYLGSGELWRLRALEDAVYERLVTQLVRHVSQGRLLRGSRRARLLVDRDRFAVGATVAVRVIAADGTTGPLAATCTVTGPDGRPLAVPLDTDPDRAGSLRGGFVAVQEGAWLIDVDLQGSGGERVSRRIQARLPDRELERPRLDRSSLEQVALLTGGVPRFLADGPWGPGDASRLTDRLVDRSRREYETGAPDMLFKQRLNAVLMGLGVGLLCLEWIVRRLVRLA